MSAVIFGVALAASRTRGMANRMGFIISPMSFGASPTIFGALRTMVGAMRTILGALRVRLVTNLVRFGAENTRFVQKLAGLVAKQMPFMAAGGLVATAVCDRQKRRSQSAATRKIVEMDAVQ